MKIPITQVGWLLTSPSFFFFFLPLLVFIMNIAICYSIWKGHRIHTRGYRQAFSCVFRALYAESREWKFSKVLVEILPRFFLLGYGQQFN